MMDRTFTDAQNAVIVEKAIRWASRGIVGVDIAGPRPRGERYPYRDLAPLVEEARAAGLGVTIHVGEEGGDQASRRSPRSSRRCGPTGSATASWPRASPTLMRELAARAIVLEICPTSNLLTKALAGEDELRDTIRAFVAA